jgi:hypothetical protein
MPIGGLGTSPAEALAKADQRRPSRDTPRPPHPAPTFVTIAKRPSVHGHGTAELMDLIWAKREGIYFLAKDWTGSIGLIGFEKFAVWRKGV